MIHGDIGTPWPWGHRRYGDEGHHGHENMVIRGDMGTPWPWGHPRYGDEGPHGHGDEGHQDPWGHHGHGVTPDTGMRDTMVMGMRDTRTHGDTVATGR